MTWPWGFVTEIRPCTTTTIFCRQRAVCARIVGVKLITPCPRGLSLQSLLVEHDELLDRPFELPLNRSQQWLALNWPRVLWAGGPGVTLTILNAGILPHQLLTRFVWEEIDMPARSQ